jgi:hypothetical protein
MHVFIYVYVLDVKEKPSVDIVDVKESPALTSLLQLEIHVKLLGAIT